MKSNLGNCDFENDGLCAWQQIHDGEDNFDWTFNSGETSSKQTGPKVDHTMNSVEGKVEYELTNNVPCKEL